MSGARATGHVIPDPGIVVGPYRVLVRTDGRWVLYDERQPPADRTAAIRSTKEAIVAVAQQLVARGAPIVSAPPEDLVAVEPRPGIVSARDRKAAQARFGLPMTSPIGDRKRQLAR